MLKTMLITLLVLTSFSSVASVWEEREFLERYVEQVEILNQTLLTKAQSSANPDARIQLNYELMRNQSEEVLNQLKHYLDSPMEPYLPLHANAFPNRRVTMNKVFNRYLLFIALAMSAAFASADTLDPASVNSVETAYNTIMGSNIASFSTTSKIIRSIVMAIALMFSGWAVYGVYEAYYDGQVKLKGAILILMRLLAIITVLSILITK